MDAGTTLSTHARGKLPPSLRRDAIRRIDEHLQSLETVTWPSKRWENDPVGFASEVLGIELWAAQIEIIESIRDHRNTTVRSGHKCGKSTALAVAALWFYSTFERARVVMTAVKASQIDEVIWKEVRRLFRGAKIPLEGTLYEKAHSGLRAADDRQIWGITARDGEGLAGISGPNVLILADEASGIKDGFFEVLGSSLAGSGGTARKCYISNPTRTTGEFYRSHTVNVHLFNAIHVSSENTPNALGLKTIPGLAGPEWIAERKLEYGEDSPQYRVRVKGEFVADRDGKIISLDLIALATEAWDEAEERGTLQLGIDSAGDGVLGDETSIAVRLGSKVLTVLAWRGINEDAIVSHALALLTKYRMKPGVEGLPRVAVDAEGGIGTRVLEKLRVALSTLTFRTELVSVRSGKKFWGSPDYDTIRDGLWGQARDWLTAGGAIPGDVKLSQELNAPIFTPDAKRRYVATPKKILRKDLGRSTDRADAVCLAIWGYASVEPDARAEDDQPALQARDSVYDPQTDINAYDVDGGGDPVYGDPVYGGPR